MAFIVSSLTTSRTALRPQRQKGRPPSNTTTCCAQPAIDGSTPAPSRRSLLRVGFGFAAASAVSAFESLPYPRESLAEDASKPEEQITFTTTKDGWMDGPTPSTGDLIAIRFKAQYQDYTFDNTFDTPTPYYFRLGNENIVKGLEQACYKLHIGERAQVVVPGALAFGKKGRRAAPGVPAIPPFSTITYEVELSEFPGHEPELIDVAGDESLVE